tara:strand:+ start:185 stop:490 length:306 start_codon:yes stop_codon:yes gene_type:complete
MILYKNNPKAFTNYHNILGFDYIIESVTHYVQLCVVNGVVDSICIQEKNGMNDSHIEEYKITLSECYEVVAFAKDIRAIVGKKIYMIESEVYPYSGNSKTI